MLRAMGFVRKQCRKMVVAVARMIAGLVLRMLALALAVGICISAGSDMMWRVFNFDALSVPRWNDLQHALEKGQPIWIGTRFGASRVDIAWIFSLFAWIVLTIICALWSLGAGKRFLNKVFTMIWRQTSRLWRLGGRRRLIHARLKVLRFVVAGTPRSTNLGEASPTGISSQRLPQTDGAAWQGHGSDPNQNAEVGQGNVKSVSPLTNPDLMEGVRRNLLLLEEYSAEDAGSRETGQQDAHNEEDGGEDLEALELQEVSKRLDEDLSLRMGIVLDGARGDTAARSIQGEGPPSADTPFRQLADLQPLMRDKVAGICAFLHSCSWAIVGQLQLALPSLGNTSRALLQVVALSPDAKTLFIGGVVGRSDGAWNADEVNRLWWRSDDAGNVERVISPVHLLQEAREALYGHVDPDTMICAAVMIDPERITVEERLGRLYWEEMEIQVGWTDNTYEQFLLPLLSMDGQYGYSQRSNQARLIQRLTQEFG